MPSLLTVLACATLAAVAALPPTWRADAQLRSGPVKDLAAGKILVAARGLPDPNFEETVILLTQHSEAGSMGLVINDRTELAAARLFPHLPQPQGPPSRLFIGGPVSPDGALALLRSPRPVPDSLAVLEDVYLITTAEAIREPIVTGTDQTRFRIYVGYSGWGAGQLARETTLGVWHVFSGEAAVVFDADPDTLWQRQVRRTDERMASAFP